MATLAMLNLATADMLNRAHYSPGSLTATEHMLYELHQQRYLDRTSWRRFERGNAKVVHKLAGRGLRYAKAHGLAPAEVIRPSDNLTQARLQITHTLRANELLVHGLELARKDPSIELQMASEPTLRRHPLMVGSGLNEAVIYPDGFLRILKHRPSKDPGEAALCFELDRATTDLERVKRKLSHWLMADGSEEYATLFHTSLQLVVWVVDEGNLKRRDQLVKAAWDLLVERREQNRADLFLFGATHDGMSAEEFFFSPTTFLRPDATPIPTSLLPQSWRPT